MNSRSLNFEERSEGHDLIEWLLSIGKIDGPFAIKRVETAKKFFFELMLFLNIFQYKNHIWHINKNFIFLAVSLLSIAKGPYFNSTVRYFPKHGNTKYCND